MYAPHFASPVLTRDELPELAARVARWLDELSASRPPGSAAEPLELGARSDLPLVVPRRALMLVGSPRGSASMSAAIASHLEGLLRGAGSQRSRRSGSTGACARTPGCEALPPP